MSAALLAALTVWLAVPGPARRRARAVLGRSPSRRPSADLTTAVTVLVPLAAIVVLGPLPGLLVAGVATPVARGAVAGALTSAARRRAEEVERQLPLALDLVVASLDAGRPPGIALGIAADATPAPLGEELAVVAARLRVGAEPATVWDQLADDPVLAPLGRAFRRADSSGMPVARVVASAVDELRNARRARARERSRRVGVRTAAPLGTCFLPAFFLVGIVPTVVGVVGGLDVLP